MNTTHSRLSRITGAVFAFALGASLAGCGDVGALKHEGENLARTVSAGDYHSCAVTGAGTLACWGLNQHGELGDGTRDARNRPTVVPGLTNVTQVATGRGFTCALLEDGTVRCFGDDTYCSLGAEPTETVDPNSTATGSNEIARTPQVVPGLSGVVEIAAGGLHACARTSSGNVRCWGRNYTYSPDDGRTCAAFLGEVPDTAGVIDIEVGHDGACGRRADGTVQCWGFSHISDPAAPLFTALPSLGLSNVAQLSLGQTGTGQTHACAVITDGTVRCWGHNLEGQLGDGTTGFYVSTPVTVANVSNAVEVSVGHTRSCARLADNTVTCWGAIRHFGRPDVENGYYYACYNRANTPPETTSDPACFDGPTPVAGLTNVAQLSSGAYHMCVRQAGGEVQCWGSNHALLGDGTADNRTAPTPLAW